MSTIRWCMEKDCKQQAVKDGFCRTHYISYCFDRFLDNRNLRDPNKGFFAFAKELFPHWVTSDFAEHHYEMVQGILELYNPIYRSYLNRQLMELIFREGAKSTINKLILAYIIAMNGKKSLITIAGKEVEIKIAEKFIVFISETEEVAVEYVDAVREEYLNNKFLNWVFPFAIESVKEDGARQFTKKAYKINSIYVLARGWGQQFRGRLKGSSRITFLFADDIYSEENIKTPEGRDKIRKKWNNGIKNSMDTLTGKVVWTATIIHEDTVTVDNIKNSLWRKIILPIMPIEKFYKFAKEHMDKNGNKYFMKYDNHKDYNERVLMQKQYYDKVQREYDWELSWGARRDLLFIAAKYQEACTDSNVSGFFQEFFHELIPESDRRFRTEYFQKLGAWNLEYKNGMTWLKAEAFENNPLACRLVLGIDKSGDGQVGITDNTVLTLTAILNRKRAVLSQVSGKFHSRDYTHNDQTKRYDVNLDDTNITVKGWMDEAIRMVIRYKVDEIKFGMSGQENADLIELQKILIHMKLEVLLNSRLQSTNKIERIFRTMLPMYESYSVWHADGLDSLEHELQILGKGSKDDHADSCECSFNNALEPDDIHQEKEEENDYYSYSDISNRVSSFDWRVV